MTLVLGDWLLTGADQPAREGWGVRVDGETVAELGPHDDLRAAHPDDDVVDAAGHVVMPGFVNGHVHLYGVLAHGRPDTGPAVDFWGFLEDHWWPGVEDRLDHAMIAAASDWVCTEMLRSGTTTFFDILEAPAALPDALFVEKEVVERRGLRALLSVEATERAGPEAAKLGLAENARLIDSCRSGDLIGGLMSWHTAFTCSATFVTEAFGLAEERGVLSHAHCNEGTHEGEWCEANLGMRTVEWYDHLGVAGPNLLASQCVQLSERERELIAERGVRVTHMPLANCEVGGGIAPVPELLDMGVVVGLGTDGYVNDMFEVMRGAFLIHKARLLDPGTMSAPTVLTMATDGGARALGLDHVGRLEPGWSADLQIVDATFPTPLRPGNLVEQLVLWRNQSHVRDVMVAGCWQVRHREVRGVDLEEMRARVSVQADRLWRS